jgi:hypothetical protein
MSYCLLPAAVPAAVPAVMPYQDELEALATQIARVPMFWARRLVARVERLYQASTDADREKHSWLEAVLRRICKE